MTTKKTTKTKPVKKPVKKTASEKRIAIAKDTIKWLSTNAIKAKSGDYFNIQSVKIKSREDKLDVTLKNVNKPCKVCALGGMFYSMVRRFDKMTTVDIGRIEGRQNGDYIMCVEGNEIVNELSKYFSGHQLALIESAFEMRDMSLSSDMVYITEDELLRASKFAIKRSYQDNAMMPYVSPPECYGKPPAVRMRMIMENIVNNKGVFKP